MEENKESLCFRLSWTPSLQLSSFPHKNMRIYTLKMSRQRSTPFNQLIDWLNTDNTFFLCRGGHPVLGLTPLTQRSALGGLRLPPFLIVRLHDARHQFYIVVPLLLPFSSLVIPYNHNLNKMKLIN